MFGTFMEVLDTNVVNVSLPHIAGSLSAQMLWRIAVNSADCGTIGAAALGVHVSEPPPAANSRPVGQ
jgi:hypothetical protein